MNMSNNKDIDDELKFVNIDNKINNTLENVNYYSDNMNNVYLTTPLNKFNNFVKRYLIDRAVSGFVKPRVMDLATGKFGDLYNFANAGVNTLVGIEIGYDNMNNPNDGAATRMIQKSNIQSIGKLASRTMLIVGNTTKNIANGDCVRDNLNKYYLDVLYGRAKGNTSKLKKMEGVANDGFDCITCMYAIHYMLNNEKELDNFLRNVSENLLDQGYFIGTCLDGMTILKELGNRPEIKGIIKDKTVDKTVFLIRKIANESDSYLDTDTGIDTKNIENKGINKLKKQHKQDKEQEKSHTQAQANEDKNKDRKDGTQYDNDNITVGNKIMVYYEKFAGEFSENLVNMSYLSVKAKLHNLKLIEYRTFLDEPGNMLSQFDSIDKENAKNIKSSETLTTWAKFNAYFIFQKVREN
jgi:hypothetical protein